MYVCYYASHTPHLHIPLIKAFPLVYLMIAAWRHHWAPIWLAQQRRPSYIMSLPIVSAPSRVFGCVFRPLRVATAFSNENSAMSRARVVSPTSRHAEPLRHPLHRTTTANRRSHWLHRVSGKYFGGKFRPDNCLSPSLTISEATAERTLD